MPRRPSAISRQSGHSASVRCYVQRLAASVFATTLARMVQGRTSDNAADFESTSSAESPSVSLVADARVGDGRLSSTIYRAIFENSLDGVMFTAPDGRIFAANDAACALLGLTEEEIVAAGRAGLMDASDPAWHDAVEQRQRDGQMRAKLRMRRGDGTVFLADVTSVIFQLDGETRACVFVRDAFDQSPISSRHFARADTSAGLNAEVEPVTVTLSPREQVVMAYLGTSMTYREIASELFISPNTLKSHIKAIYRKLGAESRSDALAKARAVARTA